MCNAIPILSPFFLYHPYIPLFEFKEFFINSHSKVVSLADPRAYGKGVSNKNQRDSRVDHRGVLRAPWFIPTHSFVSQALSSPERVWLTRLDHT